MKFDPKHLTCAQKEDVEIVLSACKQARSDNRFSNRGWSKDKVMRKTAMFPIFMLYHSEFKKYFDIEQDKHSAMIDQNLLAKLMQEKYGWNFNTVDRP